MRILATFIIIGFVGVISAPNSADLHNRYGRPDMERFVAEPGISVSAEYGSDLRACVIRIEPPKSLGLPVPQKLLMSSESVSKILEDLAPAAGRGNVIKKQAVESGCENNLRTDYESMTINRGTHTCDPSSPDQDTGTVVFFKREVCANPR